MPNDSPQPTDLEPNWWTKIFRSYLDRVVRLSDVLLLSMHGIAMLRWRAQGLKVLSDYYDSTGNSEKTAVDQETMESAAREKELAQKEVDHGFPILHEQATIALWSSLEALIRSFVAEWFDKVPDAWKVDAVKKLQVKVGDYESLDRLEKCRWVTDLLDRDAGGPLRSGIKRFESLLQPFGLSGPVDEAVQKKLFELSQIRNVLVHRSGVVDRKLAEACPWLSLKTGDHVQITHVMWKEYQEATAAYVLEITQRLGVYHGLGRYNPETGTLERK